MPITDSASFFEDAANYHTIPLTVKLFADTITPIHLFQQLQEDAVFLLESRGEASPWSRYSFIGLNPFAFLTEEDGVFSFRDHATDTVYQNDSLQGALQKALRHLRVKPPETSVPFYGGAVGWIGYDAISCLEDIPEHERDDLGLRRFSFQFCETILAYDHMDKELHLFHHVRLSGSETRKQLEERYREAVNHITAMIDAIHGVRGDRGLSVSANDPQQVDFAHVRSNYRKEDFVRDVNKIKAAIHRGEISQAVLSQRFELDLNVTGLDIYRVLRIINPSPYLFYMNMDGVEVVGSSPERLIQVEDRRVEIHPIAGTRPRGRTKSEDETFAADLLQDEKELAEHHMLVELAREEVGRVAEPGSVKTPVMMEIGTFSHVFHLVSKVTGELAEGRTPIDALLSSFPAGTVSGTPKQRAMEIIRELEPTARNLYAGAVGYFGFSGNIDSCITIRTLVIQNGTAYIQAGAGVVANSDPIKEWEETRNKAKVLIKAVELAEDIFHKGETLHVERHIGKSDRRSSVDGT